MTSLIEEKIKSLEEKFGIFGAGGIGTKEEAELISYGFLIGLRVGFVIWVCITLLFYSLNLI